MSTLTKPISDRLGGMLALLRDSLKHFRKVYSEEYRRARRLHVVVGLLSATSTILTFVSLIVTIRVPVAVTWLPYVLWGAVAACLLLLLMLGFVANYTYHTRIVGELTEAKESEVSKLNRQIDSLQEANKKTVDDLTISHQTEIASLKEGQKQFADSLSAQVRLLQEEIVESKRVKVTFEVSTAIWVSTVLLTDSGDTEDWRDATVFVMEAKLFIRYFNDDKNPIRIHGLRLSIRNDETGTEYTFKPGFMPPVFREPDATENHYFVGFVIPGNTLTDHYYHQFWFDVPPECALSLDRNWYLRVTLDAAKQDPYAVDLDVPWNAARRGDTPTSIRPS